MKAVRLAATLALVTLPLACGDIAAQAGPRLTVKLQIEMDYEDLEFGHEGYVSSYAHSAALTLTGFTFDSEITQTIWEGFEVCIEPPLRIEWESDMDFEDLAYTAPVMRALVRGDQVWILYAPAREFGVEHPGRPECNSGAYVPAGQMVAKHFFEADLADLAPPQGDFPVFIYDEEEAFGGFVLATWSITELHAGDPKTIDISYEGADSMLRIALRVRGSVTPT